jgi:hypothetical protein
MCFCSSDSLNTERRINFGCEDLGEARWCVRVASTAPQASE